MLGLGGVEEVREDPDRAAQPAYGNPRRVDGVLTGT
jgi:hypothetical protein